MPTTLKNKGAALTSTLTTTLYTAPATAGNTARIEHIIVSSSTTAGSITLSVYDLSATTSYEILNAVSITANGVLELANVILEAGDEIRGGFTTATGSKIYLAIVENT